ncbi:hypothetical protein RclHR1_01010014 [Rhizophagus clarus]|uniref:Uncharacterized protein n=1 Tax=Rhizophagus clarus TaxID=94130 RepID=A0A2Z6Q0Q6_9GLOM|nr:hypothetical protein RclHR1_01010014 [Rhizophagus clarus]GES82951.1 hypothetical protein GLOIN_2v1590059 [Rhizophagus clarus]
MPTTTNFEEDFSTQPIQKSSKRKSLTKNKFSDIRRRFSAFSPRNSIIFLNSDIDNEGINVNRRSSLFVRRNNNSSKAKHKRSVSESFKYELDFEDFEDFDFETYTPIFKRNKSQMNLQYEEPTNEVISNESSLIKSVIRKFTKIKKKRDNDKEYQDGKTNPFE